ncbi:hypothetical protein H4R21_000019 [Coemansia helicoidea]|uniref:Uncharacterized protein n=1 Tax=Coemansia helicoidea TaxID=1286919 RepID=A0ACC1LGR3_9FUNG|nr:hypothetical protein H4R21_000019 [Coemansia helicoidea]
MAGRTAKRGSGSDGPLSQGKRRRRHKAVSPSPTLESEQPEREPRAADADGLEQSMRRVTFADGTPGQEHRSPTPADTDGAADGAADEPADASPAPAAWSRDVRGRGPYMSEFRVGGRMGSSLDTVAHRTMGALVAERERSVTRRIVVHGDTGTDRLTASAPGRRRRRRHSMLLPWPSVDLHRYLGRARADALRPMGIGVVEPPCLAHAALEEPGAEWETRELDGTAAAAAADDDVDLADPLANGGIGLVIRRHHPGATAPGPTAWTAEAVEFVTRTQLLHPGLCGPRYSRAPLPDEFRDNTPAPSHHFGPLADLTRIQVLNQILCRNSPRAMPLSRFASCTVAEEAVAGVARTWAALGECLRVAQRRGREPLCTGMAATQWIAVLNAALAAGLPPEIVARAYRRLEPLCDVVAGGVASAACQTLANSFHALGRRRLRSPQD